MSAIEANSKLDLSRFRQRDRDIENRGKISLVYVWLYVFRILFTFTVTSEKRVIANKQGIYSVFLALGPLFILEH